MAGQTNPGATLSSADSAGAGSSVQLGGSNVLPHVISMVVTVTDWEASYDLETVAAYPYVNVGLEVSLDGSNWVRIANCQVNGNGVFKAVGTFPCEYARANVDELDSRVTAVTLNAYVAGA
jgi:hypothetical protein